jgi:hypothetical protein
MIESDKDVKAILIKKIIEKGLPVAVEFDFADAGAALWVKSETEVFADDYGCEFIECINRDPGSLDDISDEGLLQLSKYGVRPGEEDYAYIIKYFDNDHREE